LLNKRKKNKGKEEEVKTPLLGQKKTTKEGVCPAKCWSLCTAGRTGILQDLLTREKKKVKVHLFEGSGQSPSSCRQLINVQLFMPRKCVVIPSKASGPSRHPPLIPSSLLPNFTPLTKDLHAAANVIPNDTTKMKVAYLS
jgi:hypothetical protein